MERIDAVDEAAGEGVELGDEVREGFVARIEDAAELAGADLHSVVIHGEDELEHARIAGIIDGLDGAGGCPEDELVGPEVDGHLAGIGLAVVDVGKLRELVEEEVAAVAEVVGHIAVELNLLDLEVEGGDFAGVGVDFVGDAGDFLVEVGALLGELIVGGLEAHGEGGGGVDQGGTGGG